MRDLTHEECPFCKTVVTEHVLDSALSFAVFDAYPASPGHMLIITRRHVSDFFELGQGEIDDLMSLLLQAKEHISETRSPDGYTVGINVGKAAGQTVSHVHIHLIPRYKGDVENPRGGVRGVIPGKADY